MEYTENLIFPGQCPQCATMSPMCNTFLGSLGVAHWVHSVYYNVQNLKSSQISVCYNFFIHDSKLKQGL